jgi:tripartite-type tricarboxylate transporter receptor subunit TctC
LFEALGQQFIIDNRGGGGAPSVRSSRRALHRTGIRSMSAALRRSPWRRTRTRISLRSVQGFRADLYVTIQPLMLNDASRAARADGSRSSSLSPGRDRVQIDYASSGLGGTGHLAGELFKATARIDMQHIPYKAAAPALTD